MIVHALSEELGELDILCLSELIDALSREVECAVVIPRGFSFEDAFFGTRAKILRLKVDHGTCSMLNKVYIYRTFFKSLDCRVVHSHGSVEAALGALLASDGGRSLVKDFYASSSLGGLFRSARRRAADVVTLAYGERHRRVIEERGCDGGRVICIPSTPPRTAAVPRYAPLSAVAAAVCSRRDECAGLMYSLSLSLGWSMRVFAPRELWCVLSRYAALYSVSGRVAFSAPREVFRSPEGFSALLLESPSVPPAVAALYSSVGVPIALSDLALGTGLFGDGDISFRRGDPFSLSECLAKLAALGELAPSVRSSAVSGDTAEALVALYRSL